MRLGSSPNSAGGWAPGTQHGWTRTPGQSPIPHYSSRLPGNQRDQAAWCTVCLVCGGVAGSTCSLDEAAAAAVKMGSGARELAADWLRTRVGIRMPPRRLGREGWEGGDLRGVWLLPSRTQCASCEPARRLVMPRSAVSPDGRPSRRCGNSLIMLLHPLSKFHQSITHQRCAHAILPPGCRLPAASKRDTTVQAAFNCINLEIISTVMCAGY